MHTVNKYTSTSKSQKGEKGLKKISGRKANPHYRHQSESQDKRVPLFTRFEGHLNFTQLRCTMGR